jgi:NAD(P)-dependent dehydrogenase (short-subunit alcohol dehydrogenase family)
MPIAIVTGGNSGIGRATAVLLAERGFDVGLTYHADERQAEEAAAECGRHGVRTAVRPMDLETDVHQSRAVDELAAELGGGLDVFVNNAGGAHAAPVLELRLDDWRRTLDLDLTGAFLCLQLAARRMVEQGRGGRLVAVTSIHEHLPLRDSAAYGAAKGGLGMLVKSLALEVGPHGITANAVAPGEIATKMTGQEDQDPHDEERDLPVPRPGHAREIAGMIGFLASPEGAYTTGQSLIVDGGMTLMGPIANRG